MKFTLKPGYKLKVFRHGDRTPMPPMELYPNDPYLHYNFDPPGYGMLTTVSKLDYYTNFNNFSLISSITSKS